MSKFIAILCLAFLQIGCASAIAVQHKSSQKPVKKPVLPSQKPKAEELLHVMDCQAGPVVNKKLTFLCKKFKI